MTTPSNSNDLPTTVNSADVVSAEDLALMRGDTDTSSDFKEGDLKVARMVIVQATSGYVKRDDPNFVDAARPGDIIDDVYKIPHKHVLFVPVKFETTYTEWPANRGDRAPVKSWGTDASKYDASGTEFGTRTTAEGNRIVPSATYRGLMVTEDGSDLEVVVNMTSTQFKKSRTFNALIAGAEETGPDGVKFKPPMYSRFYKFETVTEKNDQGSWFGWKIEPGGKVLAAGPAGKAMYLKAKALRGQIEAGTARPAPAATPGRDDEDQVPF